MSTAREFANSSGMPSSVRYKGSPHDLKPRDGAIRRGSGFLELTSACSTRANCPAHLANSVFLVVAAMHVSNQAPGRTHDKNTETP